MLNTSDSIPIAMLGQQEELPTNKAYPFIKLPNGIYIMVHPEFPAFFSEEERPRIQEDGEMKRVIKWVNRALVRNELNRRRADMRALLGARSDE